MRKNDNVSDNLDSFTSPEHARMFKFSKKVGPEIQRIDLEDPKRGILIAKSPFGDELQPETCNTPVSIMRRMTSNEMSELHPLTSDNDSKDRNVTESQTESQIDLSLHKRVRHLFELI